MINHLPATAASALAAVAFLLGCGGGDGAALSRAELIEQGDAICATAEDRLEKRIHDYGHKVCFAHRLTGPSPKQEEGLLAEVILPQFGALAEELGELVPPEEEAARFEAIVDGIERVVAEGEADPRSLSGPTNPFEGVREGAAAFGFEVCGET